jgi:hypothetical protein
VPVIELLFITQLSWRQNAPNLFEARATAVCDRSRLRAGTHGSRAALGCQSR